MSARIIARHYEGNEGWIIKGERVDSLAFDRRPFIQHVPGAPLPPCLDCDNGTMLETLPGHDPERFVCRGCGSQFAYAWQSEIGAWLTAEDL